MKIPDSNKELSYLELLDGLREDIESDETITEDYKTEILETLASLMDLLWSYSD